MSDVHPTRAFVRRTQVLGMLRNIGCQELEKSGLQCTFWRSVGGIEFNLMDPDVEINGEMVGYSRSYMIELRDRLIAITSGDHISNHDGFKFHAESDD